MSEFCNNGYIVTLSETALIGIVLNGLEAYTVKHKNISKGPNHGLETFGSLFGYQTEVKNGSIVYRIEFISADTSSAQSDVDVEYNEDAIRLKADTIRSFWPSYCYLGDYHTHPGKHYREIEECKGYYFSSVDRKDLKENSNFWNSLGHRVSLLLTIGHLEKAGWRETQWINDSCNCVEFTLGNYRLWLTAYISLMKSGKLVYSDDNDDRVVVDCPSLTGLVWEQNKYGRYSKNTKLYTSSS